MSRKRRSSPSARLISTSWFVIGFATLMVLVLVGTQRVEVESFKHIFASGAYYYVAPDGDDSQAGTAVAPFRSFDRAMSVMKPGDTLIVSEGTYRSRLVVPLYGTQSLPITIKAREGTKPIIDLGGTSADNIRISGAYVTVSDLEVINSAGICVNVTGEYVTVQNLVVHGCADHGIYTDGSHVTISDNTVYETNLSNSNKSSSSGWGSAIKVRVGGDNITIQNNTVYHNYGEGIAVTRGSDVVVKNNTVYDNYSVNIYIDNSYDVLVEGNHSYCTVGSGFERDGKSASAYALGEEQYDGWGARLSRVKIVNNIGAYCNRGIIYYGADVSGGGLDNVVIAHNTFWGSQDTAVSMTYESTKTRNTVIANNIVQQPGGNVAWIENRAGIDMYNNFWVGSRPASWRNAQGSGDVSGDVRMQQTPVADESVTFRLSYDSAARDAASVMSEIVYDFEHKHRYSPGSQGADIGAIEFEGTIDTTISPTPSSTSVPSSTATPTPTKRGNRGKKSR